MTNSDVLNEIRAEWGAKPAVQPGSTAAVNEGNKQEMVGNAAKTSIVEPERENYGRASWTESRAPRGGRIRR